MSKSSLSLEVVKDHEDEIELVEMVNARGPRVFLASFELFLLPKFVEYP